eukprot:TRINITY_DN19227_c0_g1_i2.p1 TRINITY_DN19227_c0_g1~~TRINITY_DN19227_c0_g1_i2.p1  ORF type:complete len:720 (+),score=172.55 TRINITY_DN19227_c0_g1_i2:91-2250(+)
MADERSGAAEAAGLETKVLVFQFGTYRGTVNAEGLRHGQGRLQYNNGNVYEGAWADGAPNGTGTKSWANGDRYEGQWAAGKRHGHGRYTFAAGGQYEGGYVDDLPDGQGRWEANGEVYEGGYRKGQRCGMGTETFQKEGQTVRYEGTWFGGKREGVGRLIFQDGSRWEGIFSGGERKQGTLYNADGRPVSAPPSPGKASSPGRPAPAPGSPPAAASCPAAGSPTAAGRSPAAGAACAAPAVQPAAEAAAEGATWSGVGEWIYGGGDSYRILQQDGGLFYSQTAGGRRWEAPLRPPKQDSAHGAQWEAALPHGVLSLRHDPAANQMHSVFADAESGELWEHTAFPPMQGAPRGVTGRSADPGTRADLMAQLSAMGGPGNQMMGAFKGFEAFGENITKSLDHATGGLDALQSQLDQLCAAIGDVVEDAEDGTGNPEDLALGADSPPGAARGAKPLRRPPGSPPGRAAGPRKAERAASPAAAEDDDGLGELSDEELAAAMRELGLGGLGSLNALAGLGGLGASGGGLDGDTGDLSALGLGGLGQQLAQLEQVTKTLGALKGLEGVDGLEGLDELQGLDGLAGLQGLLQGELPAQCGGAPSAVEELPDDDEPPLSNAAPAGSRGHGHSHGGGGHGHSHTAGGCCAHQHSHGHAAASRQPAAMERAPITQDELAECSKVNEDLSEQVASAEAWLKKFQMSSGGGGAPGAASSAGGGGKKKKKRK